MQTMEIRHASTVRSLLTVGGASDVLTELRGLAVPYNYTTDIGPFTEEFAPGSFKDSLRTASNLPLLANHDPQKIIGVAESWQDRSDGLYGVWRIGPDTFAQETARMVRDGLLNFMSILFNSAAGNPTLKPDGREHIRWTKARLIEVSLTPIPAYATATVTGVRAHGTTLTPVHELALEFGDRGPDLTRALSAGTDTDRTAAAGIVRTAITTYGATDARHHLDELAYGLSNTRPDLAVNLARAAMIIDRAHLSESLRDAHLHEYDDLLPKRNHAPGSSTPPRRRRRP